ncbi:MAG: hypothetical protein OXG46_09970 [Chloroflexi bacterium]|nr:hypothetical protein [Chloroflexota bacterium]MCY3937343.1 hypothetical protein [Chloroflexota bacterium]
MPAPNFTNRTIWTGDNLDIVRGLNSDSVDLIYLDPPFNSNQTYAAPVGSKAAGADLGIFHVLRGAGHAANWRRRHQRRPVHVSARDPDLRRRGLLQWARARMPRSA